MNHSTQSINQSLEKRRDKTPFIISYITIPDIRLYDPYSRPNGWTEWTDIFLGNPWVPWG